MTEKEIQEMLKATANEVTLEMAKALMEAHKEGMNFKKLAKQHLNPNLEKELEGSDPLTKKVYEELFQATNAHVKEYYPPLVTALAVMNEQTGDDATAGMFLGSFVWKATQILVKEHSN